MTTWRIPCACHSIHLRRRSEGQKVLFRHVNFQKWSEHGVFYAFWLRHVLRDTTRAIIHLSSSQGAPHLPLLRAFDLPEPQIMGKTVNCDFPAFFAHLHLLLFLLLPSLLSLSILSEVWFLNFLPIGIQYSKSQITWEHSWFDDVWCTKRRHAIL